MFILDTVVYVFHQILDLIACYALKFKVIDIWLVCFSALSEKPKFNFA